VPGVLVRLLVRQVRSREISRTEMEVLSILREGPRRVTDLAELVGIAQPTAREGEPPGQLVTSETIRAMTPTEQRDDEMDDLGAGCRYQARPSPGEGTFRPLTLCVPGGWIAP
jgi:hypothetical protein